MCWLPSAVGYKLRCRHVVTASTGSNLTILNSAAGAACCLLQGFDVQFEASPSQFGAVLQQLTGLRELKLASLKMMPEQQQQQLVADAGPADAGAVDAAAALEQHILAAPPPQQALHSSDAGMQLLLRAVARLPQLATFWFIRFPVSSAAAAELAAASRLTALRLDECELADEAVAALAARLHGLHSLSLNWNFQLSDAVVGVIAGQLTGLRELALCSTRVGGSAQALRAALPGLRLVLL